MLVACSGGPTSPSTKSSVPESDLFPPPPPLPVGDALDAALAQCPTATQLQSVNDIPLAFDATALAGPHVCLATNGSADLTLSQETTLDVLIMMKALRFSQPLPWTSKALYDWFHDAINGVSLISGSGTSHCCDTPKVIDIYLGTPTAPPAWVSTELFMGVMIHEARHAEGYYHDCPGGIDDRTVSEMGAFGVQNLFFTWLADYADPSVVPAAFSPYEAWQACTQRNSAFCEEPQRSCR